MHRDRRSARPPSILFSLVLLVAAQMAACAEGTSTSGSHGGGGTGTITGSETVGGGGTAGSTTGGTSGSTTTGGTSGGGTGGTSGGGTGGGVIGGGGAGGCGPTDKLCFNICVPSDDPQFGCEDPSCAPCNDSHALAGCVAGACAILKCDAEWADCDGDPSNGCEVHLPVDPQNCGACGAACVIPHGTPGCEAGACTIGACDPPWSDCNGVVADGCEADLKSDPENCNACSAACAPGEQCQAGACGVFCEPGKANCDGDAVNGCEVDLGTILNCGFCDDACQLSNATADCQSGACVVVSCGAGFADCDGIAANGCEADLQNSANTCGGCGQPCPGGPNSTAVCNAGVCDLVCAGGYANCNSDPNDGCEQPTLTDPSNCGDCNTVCVTPNATPGCSAGVCKISTCNPSFADCDTVVATGCEVNLDNDAQHCGACANNCPTPANATGHCTAGACGFTCNAGFADCDGDAANGCEIHVDTDPLHCGSCGGACALANATNGCIAGLCMITSCNPGYDNCDGLLENGCEVNLQTDPLHCGVCATACNLPNSSQTCSGGLCVVGTCSAPFADCDGVAANGCETNTDSSIPHCGACNDACAIANGSPACAAGQCLVASCNAGFANCNNLPADGCEVNLNTSTGDCGSCGNACNLANASQSCVSGACAIATCNAGFGDCDGQAPNGCEVNLDTTVGHCGSCGNACNLANASQSCAGGACAIATCNAGFGDCDNQAPNGCEVNLNSTVGHCGSCGNACSVPNASPSCSNGSCAIASCNAGFGNCDGQIPNGCEVNLNTSTGNCGSCGNACNLANASATCTGGACAVSSCTAPYADCNNLPADGCEINTATSLSNCGACGNACNLANASASCTAGACGIASCNAGFADCDGNAANGCEVNTQTSTGNCGACGNVCNPANASAACVAGTCQVGSCSAGFANCNNLPADGCEINLGNNVGNCGVCGNACNLANAGQSCVGGACAIASCNPGFADCDGQTPNGCEINLGSNVSNCGVCGNACNLANAGQACVGGACAIATCNAGFGDCDNQAADGCETNLNASLTNCGTCGNACSYANAGAACNNGSCAMGACDAGFGDCDGQLANGCETNLNATLAHCGSCGNACTLANAANSCVAGACEIAGCNPGFANCDGQTPNGCEINLGSNAGNCGSCGNACNLPNASQSCVAGACAIAGCNPGFADCDNQALDGCETNLNVSLANCGSCGNACSYANAGAACNNGSCAMGNCNSGFGNCDGQASNGCETNLNASLSNCGSCGNACNLPNATSTCSGGSCAVSTCSAPFANCNNLPGDGCEINTNTSANNCGACGNVCNLANATAGCTGGTCTIAACNPGYADCDGNPANGCEVNTQTNVGNCGACGTICNPANGIGACVAGACQVSTCNSGYANCNNLPIDGCEVNTNTSTANCGGCGQICAPANSTGVCSSGSCTIGSCNSGYNNCNGVQGDGCEINLQTDVQNCGTCGNNCAVACAGNTVVTACGSGSCGIQSCQSGYYNLDGQCSGGCECQASGVSQACNTPASLGTVAVGATVTTSANLVPSGVEAWYTVTFTGNTNASYHPHVKFTNNPGSAFRFDIRSNCAGGTLSCGEGGVSNAITDWETFNGAGSAGYYNAIPPVGNNGTILIHVYRAAGQPVTCQQYTLQVSN